MFIKYLDNAFDFKDQENMFIFCLDQDYRIGWEDTNFNPTINKWFFHAPVYKEKLEKIDIDNKIRSLGFGEYLESYKLSNCVVNCSRPGETYYEHTHPNTLVVLYYPNDKWNREWGGETMFYSKNREHLELASEYKPNRLMIFDGEIPHSVRPPSYKADQYRFTMSFFYKKCK